MKFCFSDSHKIPVMKKELLLSPLISTIQCYVVVAHAFSLSTLKAEAGKSASKTSLVYRASSRTVKAIPRNLVSNKQTNKQTKHNLRINKTEVQGSELKWPTKLRAHRLT